MKRPIVRYVEIDTGEIVGSTLPDREEWTERQSQVSFALSCLDLKIRPYDRSYIAYYYGECNFVISFVRFFNDFWYAVGQFLEKDSLDLIDEKFIDWVEVMQFKEHAREMSMDFDRAFKRFYFTGE